VRERARRPHPVCRGMDLEGSLVEGELRGIEQLARTRQVAQRQPDVMAAPAQAPGQRPQELDVAQAGAQLPDEQDGGHVAAVLVPTGVNKKSITKTRKNENTKPSYSS